MTDKELKKLAIASFTRGNIDSKKIIRIAPKLKRSELRKYIKYLKIQIAKDIVRVQVPNMGDYNDKELKKKFFKLFPNKKFVVEENPDLILGVRVIDNDKIYDFNLKNSFEEMNEQFLE